MNLMTDHLKLSSQEKDKRIKRNEERLQDLWDIIENEYMYRGSQRWRRKNCESSTEEKKKKKKTFITTKGIPIKLSVDFSEENLQCMRGAKRVNLLTKNALPVKAPFRNKSEIKILSNKS